MFALLGTTIACISTGYKKFSLFIIIIIIRFKSNDIWFLTCS
jgi:hypothetical protein